MGRQESEAIMVMDIAGLESFLRINCKEIVRQIKNRTDDLKPGAMITYNIAIDSLMMAYPGLESVSVRYYIKDYIQKNHILDEVEVRVDDEDGSYMYSHMIDMVTIHGRVPYPRTIDITYDALGQEPFGTQQVGSAPIEANKATPKQLRRFIDLSELKDGAKEV